MSAKFTPVRRLCTRIASFWSKRRVFGQAGDPSEKHGPCLGEEKAEPDELLGVFRPCPVELMRAYPVGVRVRNVRKQ